MVRDVEWEKDPEPVPRCTDNFQNATRAIGNKGSRFSESVAGVIGSILSDHNDQR